MISYAVVNTAPAGYPVSVAEIKTHAIISHAGDDTLIEQYLKAAINELDPPFGYLGRAMREQTIIAYLKKFPGDRIYLPYPPLISVTSIKYLDSDGAEQTVDSSEYEVVTGHEPGYVVLADGETWTTDLDEVEHPIYIEYQAGYEDAAGPTSTVPDAINLYLMMIVSEMYRQRELSTMIAVKSHWNNFIDKYRFRFTWWDE